jgi:cysteine-rich repeat protein
MMGRSRVALGALACAAIVWSVPRPARATFHLAEINEFMTSYGGDPNAQFVEIEMLATGQQFVKDTVLGAFDSTGAYLGDVLVVPADVLSGANRTWLMGTTAYQNLPGAVAPDFVFTPGLPTTGGMVCWGAPGVSVPPLGSWNHTNPANYVDCVSYGTYSGPSNVHTSAPTTHDADGHSLLRTRDTNSSLADFACTSPATPRENGNTQGSLAATTACGSVCGNLFVEAGESCDDGDLISGDGCESDCTLTPPEAVEVPALPRSLALLLPGLLLAAGGLALRRRRAARALRTPSV